MDASRFLNGPDRAPGSRSGVSERRNSRRDVHFALENNGWNWAVSGGGCTVDDGVQYFGGGLSVQDFSWAAVEPAPDGLDLGVGDVGEAGALGEVLADQAVGVLVGGTPPGAVRIGEADLDVGGGGGAA